MKIPQPEIKTLDDLAEWCGMPKGELQNHMACCFKGCADFTDYVDHDQFFSRHNNAEYIRLNTVQIRVMSIECDEQAVHMVWSTGTTRWRTHKPWRNDTVRLWIVPTQDSRFNLTPRWIQAHLKYLFIIPDAESSVDGLLDLVQTFETGLIRKTAGMLIVKQRHQPLIQPLHDGRYHCKSLFGTGTTHIIRISTIQRAVHFLLRMSQVVLATVPVLDPAGFIGLHGNSLTPSKIDNFLSEPSL